MTWFRAGGGGIPASLKNGMNAVLNKKFGTSGQTYAPNDWPDDVNLLGKLPEKTASGALVNITDGADDVPLKELIFSASPVQAAGTPSPSNPLPISGHVEMNGVHTGKNLLPNKTYQRNANTLRIGTDTLDGRLSLKAGTYTLSITSNVVIGTMTYTIGGTSTSIQFTSSGTRYYGSFTLSADTDDMFIHIYKSGGYTAENISDFMLEVGSTVTNYEAYSVETKKWSFPPFGKNLWQYGDQNVTATYIMFTLDKPLPAGTYTVSAVLTSTHTSADMRFRKEDGSAILTCNINANSPNRTSRTITLTETAYRIYLYSAQGQTGNSATWKDIQIEAGESATSYEPYQSMFAGSVNALTGEVNVTHKIIVYTGADDEAWDYASGGYRIARPSDADVTDGTNAWANMAVCTTATTVPDGSFRIASSNLIVRLGTGDNDVQTFKTFLSNNNFVVVYPLATPITITLDSVEWQTQLGVNNFWTDGENEELEITYRADIDLALAQSSGTRGLMMASRSISPMSGEEASLDRENILESEDLSQYSDSREEVSENSDNEESEEER